MKLIKNLNNSTFLEVLNNILEFSQKKLSFLSENSIFIKYIDYLISFFAISSLVASTFLDSEKLGLIILIAFALFILKAFAKPDFRLNIDKFDFLVTLYLIFFCLATLFSSWFTDSLHGLIKVFTYFFSYIVFKDTIKTNSSFKFYYLVLISILCSTESLIGIHQQIFGVDSLATWQDLSNVNSDQIMTRVFGTLKPLNPNLLAGYLIATMPAVLGCTFYNFKKIKINFIAAIGLFATFLAIIFTGCRGSYVAITAQMAVFVAISGHIIWHDFKEKKYLQKIWLGTILAGILGILTLVFSQEALRARICSIFAQRDDSSNSFRFNVYQSSLKMFKDNFLCGIGVGNWTFREVYGLYMRTGFDALGAYCVPLEIAVETGILGLINFIVFITTSIITSIKKITSNISYNEKIITSAIVISIVGMMVHGMVDTVWFRPQIQFIFWTMIAILSIEGE